MSTYSYVDTSSVLAVYTTIGKVKSLNKNNYKSDGLVDMIDKQITSIMKVFQII